MNPLAPNLDLVVREAEPLNAGPRLTTLAQNFITPRERFFIRTHGTIPVIDPDTFRLRVDGRVGAPLELDLETLRQSFPVVTMAATLQCAGNRRSELMEVAPMPGEVPWGAEAVGTATWTGVRLCDVMEAAHVSGEARHVEFSGLDSVERHGHRFGFGGSIPLDKARGPEVLLAWEMNGAPLSPEHGAPLRVVVPGVIGARSVKWVSRISLRDTPSENHFQRHAYRMFPPEVRADSADWDAAPMLNGMPVSAVITAPSSGDRRPPERLTVTGYALSGTGSAIFRVEFSIDGGTTWHPAELLDPADPWTWRRFRFTVTPPGPGPLELVVRARDALGNEQPAEASSVWNFKGYLNNAWHRVTVAIDPAAGAPLPS